MCWIKVDWNGISMNWVVWSEMATRVPPGGLGCATSGVGRLFQYWHTHTGRLLGRWTHPVDSLSPKESAILRSPPTDPNFFSTGATCWTLGGHFENFICFFFCFEKKWKWMLFDVWTARGLWGCRVSTQLSPWQGRWSRSLQGHGRLNGRNSVVDCPASLEQKPFG